MKFVIYFFYVVCLMGVQSFAMSSKPAVPKIKKVSGKSTAYFNVQMSFTDNGNGDLKVVAQVYPQKNMNQATILWKVPDKARLIDGEKEQMADFVAGEKQNFSIVLDKESLHEKDQIFIFTYKNINGERHGVSQSLVYSLPPDVQKGSLQKKSPQTPKYFE